LHAGANDYATFRAQMLGVVNLRLPPGRQKASFTDDEETAIQAQWHAATAAHQEQMVGLTLKAQGQAIAQQQREATAGAAGAASAGGLGSANAPGSPSAHAGADAGGAEHGHGSPHNPEQIDVDKIDIEDLVAKIYDRVRSRLRLELLIDRERAGLLTDFR
jgi:hypothetical protein